MKIRIKKLLSISTCGILLTFGMSSQASVIIEGFSAFGAGGLGLGAIDGDWHGNASGFSIGSNTLTHNPSGLSSDGEREGMVGQIVDLSSKFSQTLKLSFDYNVGTGNTLYVHLRGFNETGGTPSWDQTTWATNGNAWDGASNGDAYNFHDGLLLADSGSANKGGGDEAVALTGSDTFSLEIDLQSYALSVLGDYEYLMLGFAANTTQTGNTSTINNLLLESVTAPEPSSLALLGMGAALLSATRKRKLLKK